MSERKIPVFKNEYDEADWWYAHRAESAFDLVRASKSGQLGPGSIGRRAQKLKQMQIAGYLDSQSLKKLRCLCVIAILEEDVETSPNRQNTVLIQEGVLSLGDFVANSFTARFQNSFTGA